MVTLAGCGGAVCTVADTNVLKAKDLLSSISNIAVSPRCAQVTPTRARYVWPDQPSSIALIFAASAASANGLAIISMAGASRPLPIAALWA